MRIVGLDLSLTSTGVATIAGGDYTTTTLKTPAAYRGHDRMRWILERVRDLTEGAQLVVVEGPSYGSTAGQKGHHERGGLWWLVTHRLWLDFVPLAVVPPAVRAAYATGKGNAGKDAVLLEVARRFPLFNGGNDEADALVLAAMGADHLGQPLIPMPQNHRAALAKAEWPA